MEWEELAGGTEANQSEASCMLKERGRVMSADRRLRRMFLKTISGRGGVGREANKISSSALRKKSWIIPINGRNLLMI